VAPWPFLALGRAVCAASRSYGDGLRRDRYLSPKATLLRLLSDQLDFKFDRDFVTEQHTAGFERYVEC
jgi:hypothetical protein